MAEGGTMKARIEAIKKELDDEHKKWIAEGLQNPGIHWRLGNNEFMLFCHVWALDTILRELLGEEGQDRVQLAIFEKTLEEMKKLFPMIAEAKREAIRQAIVANIKPDI